MEKKSLRRISPETHFVAAGHTFSNAAKQKAPPGTGGAFCFVRSLTMTYFHIRMYTIIGAKSFHCPVRDGKEWDQLAIVVRHNCLRLV